MSKYRNRLPQLPDRPFLTDGGLETTLIFHDRVELPYFAAFDLLKDDAGTAILRRYFTRYADLARAKGTGIVLESATWRANPDWASKLGYDAIALAEANRKATGLLLEIRDALESPATPIVARYVFGKNSMPASPIATVRPENAVARPAVPTARATLSETSPSTASSSRKRLTTKRE